MEHLLTKIRHKRDRLNEKLKWRLDRLSPTAKLNSILIVLLFYAATTVVMLVNAFQSSGRQVEMTHIEPAPLIDAPVKPADSIAAVFPKELKYNNH